RLSLAYADPRNGSYVAIAGTGRVLRDSAKARRLWSVEQRAYYPGGPRDERLGVLRVAVERAEYWISPGRTSRMIAALKAAITRRPAGIVGRNARIP
ncbi:MAG: pyridoxamine 5'-phosphate oxidase family protein, partial [Gammaproteobacteria bacterium]|nr:pyridoxamine 5'-phosphate oxidase family protein [Gammaproteobacteria bacterium]